MTTCFQRFFPTKTVLLTQPKDETPSTQPKPALVRKLQSHLIHMQKTEQHFQVFNAEHQQIGHFNGEFFYTNPKLNLRVDGDEVYTQDIPCKFVGHLRNNQIELLDGSIPYYLKD